MEEVTLDVPLESFAKEATKGVYVGLQWKGGEHSPMLEEVMGIPGRWLVPWTGTYVLLFQTL